MREDACEIGMCAEPCRVIECLVIKSQHVSCRRFFAAMRYSQENGAAHSISAATTAGKTSRGEVMNPKTVLFGPGLLRKVAANWFTRLEAPSKARAASKAVGKRP